MCIYVCTYACPSACNDVSVVRVSHPIIGCGYPIVFSDIVPIRPISGYSIMKGWKIIENRKSLLHMNFIFLTI